MPIRKAYGWRPGLPKKFAARYTMAKPKGATRPAVVDFRTTGLMPAVVDQGQLGSCTANAIATLIQFLQNFLKLSRVFLPSRLFIYYCERDKEGTVSSDSGASIDDEIAIVRDVGAPPETDWPYDTSKFTDKPPQAAYDDAKLDHIPNALLIDGNDIEAIMDSIEAFRPVAFGFVVYSSFESASVAQTGNVPMPTVLDSQVGGHAVWIFGYDTNRKVFMCRNSWAADWGDKGDFYLPFDYAADSTLAGPFYSVSMVEESAP